MAINDDTAKSEQELLEKLLQHILLYSLIIMRSVPKKFWLTPVLLIIVIVSLHIFSSRADWVENIYSAHVYPVIASLLRILTRYIPFSFGDVLYTFVFAWLLIAIIRFFGSKPTWKKLFISLRNFVVKCLWVYIIFLIFWALNYYREGIGYKMDLIPEKYSTKDLKKVTAQLRDELNMNRRLMDSLHINYTDDKTTFSYAIQLYDSAKKNYPFLAYGQPDVKKMMFGVVGDYCGYLGYYNPFTGEAQVNTKVPPFIIPFTACHEIGHQIGFASESEASFAGYLVVRSGNSVVFNYSAYFDLFGYANGELFVRDSASARENIKLLDTLVRKDYVAYRKYFEAYKNPLEPLLTALYGNYLKAHNQPKGIESYDEVVAWLVAYYKKYGKV